jgi:hypothetical protein
MEQHGWMVLERRRQKKTAIYAKQGLAFPKTL